MIGHDDPVCRGRCYACSVVLDVRDYDTPRAARVFADYERVVEYLESLPPGARIERPAVWRALGGGPPLVNVIRNVFRDMRLHGLLRCVRTDRSGRSCYVYVLAGR